MTQVEARLASATPAADGELTWLPAWRIRELVARREVSPVEVTDHFLGRVEGLDPALHAFRMIDVEGARDQARRAEAAVLAGDDIGPLHGVPFALKEFFPIQGMTWQNLLLAERATAERDGVEAERLRRAGAILFGPTIAGLTAREFGDSDRQPQNPWDRQRVCGDSSTGAACAVSSAMVPAAIGTDGRGSNRLPAAYCGLVGMLATRGRVASFDWAHMGPRLLSAPGPLARDVRDAATILSVLSGPDPRDMFCLPDDPPDFLSGIEGGARGLRLVWTDDFGYASTYAGPDSLEAINELRRIAFELSVAAGAEIEETKEVFEDPSTACDAATLSDSTIAVYGPPPGREIVRARESRARIWETFTRVLEGRDFILSPTFQGVAPTRQEWANGWKAEGRMMNTYAAHTAAANLLGWPAVSIPAGLLTGMPIGLQIMGTPNSEPRMLQLAQALLAQRGSRGTEPRQDPGRLTREAGLR